MEYMYEARDRDGRRITGRVESADRLTALNELEQRGLVVTGLKALRWHNRVLASLHRSRSIPPGELARFVAQFSTLLDGGVPLLAALELLEEQSRGQPLGKTVSSIRREVEGGMSLSGAMQHQTGVLPDSLIYVTQVAEMTGQLGPSFRSLAKQYEREDQLVRKLRTTLAYPAVVLVVAFFVVLFMVIVVLPRFAVLFRQMEADLPASTAFLLDVSAWLVRFWWAVMPAGFVGAVGITLLIRQPRVRRLLQVSLLKTPAVGVFIRQREAARIARGLGTLLAAGVPLLPALRLVERSLWLEPVAQEVAAVAHAVMSGATLGEALGRHTVLGSFGVQMVRVGENAGTLHQALMRVADEGERDVSARLDRAGSIVEPMLTVVLGGIVLSVILPMVLPMFNLLGRV